MVLRAICAVALLILSASAVTARGPYGSVKIGNWSGGAFTHDTTGAFTGCVASAPYKSGITVVVMVSPEVTWNLGFVNSNWSLKTGATFPIVLTFDGRPPFNVNGRVISANSVSVDMPDTSDLIKQFRASTTMSAFAEGNLFQFNLDKTGILLPALVNCVATVKRDGVAGARDFVLPQRPPATAARTAPAPQTGSSLTPASGPSTPELQIEAMEFASNFILKAALNNARVLSRAETPPTLVNNGAAWRSDDAIGFVRILPTQGGLKGLDVASAIVANDAKDCKGKFASARNSELVDSDVVFRGMSSCEDSERASISQYFILPRKKGGFVLFSVVANLRAEEARNPLREEKNKDFRKAALVAVGP
ncbi:MAG: trypsin-like serine protease with C-terminal domain containing [Bradyrhizobium sp.]|nr:trypsin-like serine protease with C-terminal domain containing [Bradyrhizobium sp.]